MRAAWEFNRGEGASSPGHPHPSLCPTSGGRAWGQITRAGWDCLASWEIDGRRVCEHHRALIAQAPQTGAAARDSGLCSAAPPRGGPSPRRPASYSILLLQRVAPPGPDPGKNPISLEASSRGKVWTHVRGPNGEKKELEELKTKSGLVSAGRRVEG